MAVDKPCPVWEAGSRTHDFLGLGASRMAAGSRDSAGRENLPTLTGVRAFAALLVLFLHANQNFPNPLTNNELIRHGYLGVELFFVLSGFIIAHVYLRDLVPPRGKVLRVFLWHRFIRLFPVHAVVLLGLVGLIVAARFAGVTLNEPESWSYRDLPWHFLMVHAWGAVDVAGWNAPSWSISAEWFAYLLFPGVAAAAPVLPRRAALLLALGALAIEALLFHILGGRIKLAWIGPPALIRVSAEFICGVLLYRAFRFEGPSLPSRASDALGLGGIVAFCIAAALAAHDLVLIALLAISIPGLSGGGPMSRTVFGNRTAIWLGEISYSMYIVHFPVLLVLSHGIKRALPESASAPAPLFLFAISIAVVIASAAALYYAVERPARRRLRDLFGTIQRHAVDERPPVMAPGIESVDEK